MGYYPVEKVTITTMKEADLTTLLLKKSQYTEKEKMFNGAGVLSQISGAEP